MTLKIRGSFRPIHWAMLAAGLGLAGWAVFVLVGPAQKDGAGAETKSATETQEAVVAEKAAVPEQQAAAPVRRPAPARGSKLGQFEVPRLGLSYALLEGTDNHTLDKSIGHVEGTGLPGDRGNIGIAGHRNTHFRKLEWVRRGDEIVLTDPQGKHRYAVEWIRLVTPEAVDVLDPKQGPAITLITCFPFEYVGSAPLRFIVRAVPVIGQVSSR